MDLKAHIRDVPDFPKEGIVFKDVTTLLASPEASQFVWDTWEKQFRGNGITAVVGIESRGFIFGAPLADRLKIPFVPVRKPGKLPAKTIRREYALEYGTDCVEIHADALKAGDRVVVIDDLLATGGTAAATGELVKELGAEVMEMAFVIELSFLKARATKLSSYRVSSLVQYDSE
ncbi:MAG: adenine phosphoribosyltransferase [Candidatus Hydrogenedentota bacterium]|nr:MAG: adenine phosphoribosyltransferase [Candidatus Hydrogenedentota bacterium]